MLRDVDMGPSNIVSVTTYVVVGEDLRSAALRALALDPMRCRAFAERFSWKKSAEQFVNNLVPVTRPPVTIKGNPNRAYEIPNSI